MSLSTVGVVALFYVMQVVAQVLFTWGSAAPGRWLWGFFGGNLLGFSSIWLLMLVYRAMSPNVALGICGGGSFLLAQVALAAVFRTDVSWAQWGGIATIVAGMVLLALGKTTAP